jgi:CMP-N,N'-diacetyllegionaminic acid synthase
MKTLALIPARAGSKGVPGKNKRDFCGKPLMAWAVEVGVFTCTWAFVSSEDEELLKIGRQYGGMSLKRPEELAEDTTPMLKVIKHALAVLRYLHPDIVVLLQPTAPLRTGEDVVKAVKLLRKSQADSVVSVRETTYGPEWMFRLEEGRLYPSPASVASRRQDLSSRFVRDGTVYAFWRQTLERYGNIYGPDCRALVIPPGRSCNIDTERDWHRAEFMKRERDGLRQAV